MFISTSRDSHRNSGSESTPNKQEWKKKIRERERKRKGKKDKRGKKVKKKTISDRGYSLFLTIAFTEREGPNTFSRSGRPIFQTARHSERIDEVRAPAKQPFRPWGRLASWDVGLLAVRGTGGG